tara:strand:+ start:13457 stop:14083 length:627 start_codon:yes stop_codon:yes gene_type:complete
MIGLINYGSGNIHAIANIYKLLNIPYYLVDSPSMISKADKLILPGVGDFDETMKLLREKGFTDSLNEYVIDKEVPILGVCVGMQILCNGSEEGNAVGFGWIPGYTKKLDESKLDHKPYLPHMGWNTVDRIKESNLFADIRDDRGFYFLHTYYFECEAKEDVLGVTTYGDDFASAVRHKNVFGLQFHPEKSHFNGMKIFENYAKLDMIC